MRACYRHAPDPPRPPPHAQTLRECLCRYGGTEELPYHLVDAALRPLLDVHAMFECAGDADTVSSRALALAPAFGAGAAGVVEHVLAMRCDAAATAGGGVAAAAAAALRGAKGVAEVTCEGWLMKQGGRVKALRRRYFRLRGCALRYFGDARDAKPIREIALSSQADVWTPADVAARSLRGAAGGGGGGGGGDDDGSDDGGDVPGAGGGRGSVSGGAAPDRSMRASFANAGDVVRTWGRARVASLSAAKAKSDDSLSVYVHLPDRLWVFVAESLEEQASARSECCCCCVLQ